MVDWKWIGGGKVEGRVVVMVEWGSDKWRWRLISGGSGGEGGGEGNLSVVAVVRAVEMWWIGGGTVSGLTVDWWWQG